MALRRAPLTDVRPLELWDAVVSGRTLFAWQMDPSFPLRVVEAIARFNASLVYIAGGRDDLVAIADAVRSSGRRCLVDAAGPYAGVRGAERLAGAGVLGVDIGQTSIKAWHGERRVRHARDWSRLPLEVPGMSPEELQRGEDNLVSAMAEALGELSADARTAVIAVPAEVDSACAIHGSSYPYRSPNRTLAARLAALTGADDVILCNDAELVAHSAAAVIDAPALVLTFGWGVGAAELMPL